MKYRLNEVLKQTIYEIVESNLAVDKAYRAALDFLKRTDEDTFPSQQEVDVALEIHYENLVSKYSSDERLNEAEEKEFFRLMDALIEGY